MGANDYHVDYRGKLRQELEPKLEELVEHRDSLDERIYKKLLETQPMLKGNGFIAIDPANPVFNGEEHKDLADAVAEANNLAYNSRAGVAIVYLPVEILRPSRPVVNSQPSDLFKQLQGLKGQAIAITEGQTEKKTE